VLFNRVITTLAEGMAAQEAMSGEIAATPCTISFYCLNRIAGAGGSKTTGRWEQGRNKIAIPPDKPDKHSLYGQTLLHGSKSGGRHAARLQALTA